jgi:photosystem II stability/assembly factor-like uncharacterized protein
MRAHVSKFWEKEKMLVIKRLILLATLAGSLWGCINIPDNFSNVAFGADKPREISTDHLYAVSFVDDTHGWASGIRGIIYYTEDGGATWAKQDTQTSMPLLSISFCNRRVGWAVGKSGIIIHTTDGGVTWNEQVSPKKKNLFKVHALNAETCWAVGDWGTILLTEDGGETWQNRSYSEDVIFYDLDFQGANEGWIAGEFGAILHTSDGGATWHRQPSVADATLFSVSFSSELVGMAVGLSGAMQRTDDGGKTWKKILNENGKKTNGSHAVKPSLYEVKLRGDIGIIGGDAGTVMSSKDGGWTWNTLPLPIDFKLLWFRGVSLTGSHGVVVGANSIAIITDDEKLKHLGFLPHVVPAGKN